MKKYLFKFFVINIILHVISQVAFASTTKPVSTEELLYLIKNNEVIIIDLRRHSDFENYRIVNTISIPTEELISGNADSTLIALNDNKIIVLYCQQDGQSRAVQMFLSNKFPKKQIVFLKGGIDQWQLEGFPIVKNSAIPITRQIYLLIGFLTVISYILYFTISTKYAAFSFIVSVYLIFAGFTGWNGLENLISRIPWNTIPTLVQKMHNII